MSDLENALKFVKNNYRSAPYAIATCRDEMKVIIEAAEAELARRNEAAKTCQHLRGHTSYPQFIGGITTWHSKCHECDRWIYGELETPNDQGTGAQGGVVPKMSKGTGTATS